MDSNNSIQAVLFDLDGTFADTAPDLAAALNLVLEEEGKQPLPFEKIRPHVSHGGIALIKLGFNIKPEDPDFARLRQRFLSIYEENISVLTTLFDGIEELLQMLESKKIPWGIVTNKPGWLTDPLMEQLNMHKRAATIVSGDTTDKSKPHPAPLFFACTQINCNPAQCIYVGDAERDIIAGKAAGMYTLTALFGYIEEHESPESWGADAMISHPKEIAGYLSSS